MGHLDHSDASVMVLLESPEPSCSYPCSLISQPPGSLRDPPLTPGNLSAWLLGIPSHSLAFPHLSQITPLQCPHWNSAPLQVSMHLASLSLVSQGRSHVSSICFSLNLISGISLGTSGAQIWKRARSLWDKSRPPQHVFIPFLGHRTSPWLRQWGDGQGASLAPSLGSAGPQVPHPSGHLPAPLSILDDSRRVEGGPVR